MNILKRVFRRTTTPPDYASVWRHILVDGDRKSWVAFKNGTCVILTIPQGDLKEQAVALMKEWGQVHAGSPAGDFSTVKLTGHPGWVVTCHHSDILTYVAPEELLDAGAQDITIGLHGRSKRDQDAKSLEVIHVEDKRK
jgi:hypothetical protein